MISFITIMRAHKSISSLLIILGLLLGINSGCSAKKNLFDLDLIKNLYTSAEKVKKKKFTIMYKPQFYAGHTISKMHLYPVKLSTEQIRRQMQSLKYKEFSLFAKKKSVFNLHEINSISALIKKSLNRAPKNKIVFYTLETSSGTTEGIIFASDYNLNWKFFSIQGLNYSKYPRPTWGKWKLAPGPGQKYHMHRKKNAPEALENWIEIPLPKGSRESRKNTLSLKGK